MPITHWSFKKGEKFCFDIQREKIHTFSINFLNKIINIEFIITKEPEIKAQVACISQANIVVKFPETQDIDFIIRIYTVIRNFFCFVCNRQNISLRSATLIENTDAQIPRKQQILFFDKYLEPNEDGGVIAKTPSIGLFQSRLGELLELFFKRPDDNEGIVSVSSIHRSVKYRNLIDLGQTLNMTSAFEYYVRKMTPDMHSEQSQRVLEDLKVLIQGYIDKSTGKAKEKAKGIQKLLRDNISLSEKVNKVYKGYKDWPSLSPALSEWFNADNVKDLAKVLNDWRNEMAHKNLTYKPSENVIRAMDLVEHLNYCIVLRKAGYEDGEIKLILEQVLSRWR